jgi:hypothetical protein
MGKHAYLIMAHNQFQYLKTLIESIDDSRNDIYIHIDRKTNFTDFDLLKQEIHFSSVYFIKQRKVNWAAYSGILCELDLLKVATSQNQYDYYHLLSGADVVIKKHRSIHQFFDQNKGREYVEFDAQEMDKDYLDRIKYYYLLQDIYGRNRKNVFFLMLYVLDKLLIDLQKMLKINRIKEEKVVFQKGSNWFSITHDFALHVISQEKWINKVFKFSLSGDEMFLQTILINSRFCEMLSQPTRLNENCNLRLIDWTRGKPYIWRQEDYDIIINSDMFYARKVNPDVDNEIINMINKTINKK